VEHLIVDSNIRRGLECLSDSNTLAYRSKTNLPQEFLQSRGPRTHRFFQLFFQELYEAFLAGINHKGLKFDNHNNSWASVIKLLTAPR
jgi:hypothetical protein